MHSERIISSTDCLKEGIEYLSKKDSRFAKLYAEVGVPPLRLRDDGFEALLNAILSQQVSVASAQSIWQKTKEAGLIDAQKILIASDQDFAACGFSRPKMRYARALAQADIDFKKFHELSTEKVVKVLTSVTGIGTWTAEIYAKFSLGRADVFAAGDLALQEASKEFLGLKSRPTEKEMKQIALAWSPWRSVAARLLWAYYRQIKSKEGIGL